MASAPGRICLAGESLDWMTGDPSITAAIPARTTVQVRQGQALGAVTFNIGTPFNVSERVPLTRLGMPSEGPVRYLQATAHELTMTEPLDMGGLVVETETSLPVAAGTSSSAALTVAACSAVLGFKGMHASSPEVAVTHAYAVERDRLRTGAGWMDFLACAHGGVAHVQPNTAPKAVRLADSLQCSIILVDTMERRKTSTVLATKRARFARSDPALTTYVAEVGHVVRELASQLAAVHVAHDEVGSLVNHAQQLLRRLVRCSTDLIDECASRMVRAGAYGAKLSGSGYGGCLFGLAPPDAVGHIRSRLAGLPVAVYEFDDCEPRGLMRLT